MASAEIALIQETNESTLSSGAPKSPGKDSRYSWLVVACGFITQVLILGVLHAFGVFFVEFIRTFKETKARAAWVGSVAYGLSMTFGPIVSILVNRYGNRIVMVMGCIICAISVLASSFVSKLNYLFGTFSIIYGIGACMAISPTMTIAPDYFDKYMTTAVGLMTAGSSIGTLIMAPLSQALIDVIGWRNTFRCFTGTCLFSAACCWLIKPLSSAEKKTVAEKIKQSPAKKLMQELKLWKNRVFVVWTLAITCVMFGFYIPYVHLVAYAKDQGIPPEKGSILVMLLGGCTAFGRVLFGRIVQSRILNRLHMHQLSMVVTGTAVMMLPLIKSFAGIIMYVVTIGLVDGCYVVLLPVLTTTLLSGENIVSAWGFLIGTSSVTFTLGPPVAGALYDALGSYDVAFHIAGIPVISGAIILFLIPWAQRTSKTNNIIIVVSDENMAEGYDMVEDIGGYTQMDNPESGTDSDRAVTPEDVNLDFPSSTRERRGAKTFRDQSTSTCLDHDSTQVPSDVQEAIRMLQENARIIANMLDMNKIDAMAGRSGDTNIEGVSPSVKSRSEMVQPTSFEGTPTKMVSIMSIPGGLAISQWEPTNKQGSLCSLPSSLRIPSSFPEGSCQFLPSSSLHSTNPSDSMLRESSSAYLPIPGPYGMTTGRSPNTSANLQAKFEISPKQNSLESHSPTGLMIRPSQKENMSSDQQKTVTSPTNAFMSTGRERQETSTGSPITSPRGNSLGSPLTSPRGKSQLSSIPEGKLAITTSKEIEIDRKSKDVDVKPTELPILSCVDGQEEQSDLLEKWLEHSPNEQFSLKMKENMTSSERANSASSLQSSSSASSATPGADSACRKSSSRELDVFDHLFNDDNSVV